MLTLFISQDKATCFCLVAVEERLSSPVIWDVHLSPGTAATMFYHEKVHLRIFQQERWFIVHVLHSATTEDRASAERHRTRRACFGVCKVGLSVWLTTERLWKFQIHWNKIQAIAWGLTTCASLPSLLPSIFLLLYSQWVYKIAIYLVHLFFSPLWASDSSFFSPFGLQPAHLLLPLGSHGVEISKKRVLRPIACLSINITYGTSQNWGGERREARILKFTLHLGLNKWFSFIFKLSWFAYLLLCLVGGEGRPSTHKCPEILLRACI